ncbi:conserved protein, unknown function [Hepatocystis sp. ex Piliocolobus tephrosceles]|nr:conserved protein, unknown function [Hepatocystis sp. ex Piliocolobus tephrosceles]
MLFTSFSFIFLSIITLSSLTLQKVIPTVRWGQNSYKLTLVVVIPSLKKNDVKFTENNLYLSAVDEKGEDINLNINFLRPIKPEDSTYNVIERGLKLKIVKQNKEPCWKRLTKEDEKINYLLKDKTMGDPNDCEDAKYQWLQDYKLYIRRKNPKKEAIKKKSGPVDSILESLSNIHGNFSIHEY